VPGAKQVFREYAAGEMRGDVIGRAEEDLPGRRLLAPFVRSGCLVREETIEQMRGRARSELMALPAGLRDLEGDGESYPVAYSQRCRSALEAVDTRATP
jgi:nicotinate phosphoribosyltransferase